MTLFAGLLSFHLDLGMEPSLEGGLWLANPSVPLHIIHHSAYMERSIIPYEYQSFASNLHDIFSETSLDGL